MTGRWGRRRGLCWRSGCGGAGRLPARLQVLGLGYAPPLLDGLAGGAHVLAAMPAGQGALRWPARGRCRTVLTEEAALPFPDLAFDRVLLAHDVETSDHLAGRLREIWRILAAEGRLMVIAPNRRGLWARFEHTPFGHGRPWSRAQLERLLREAMFEPLGSEEALFAPPLRRLVRPGAAEAWERFGRPLPAGVRRGGHRRSGEARRRGHAAPSAVAPGPAGRRAGAAAERRSSLRAASQPISAALRASPHS